MIGRICQNTVVARQVYPDKNENCPYQLSKCSIFIKSKIAEFSAYESVKI